MKTYTKLIYLTIFLYLLLVVYLTLTRIFGWDELEHIHSSFLVFNGKIPYRDFFQHHHGLIWYLYAPIFYISKNTTTVLYLIKIVSILVGFLNLWLIYIISKRFISSQKLRLLVVFLISSSIIFLNNGMEIRPDNLMITFILLSYFILCKDIQTKSLLMSGLFMGLSILTLQKAIVFVPILNLILIAQTPKPLKWKNLSKNLLVFNFTAILPLIFTGIIIYLKGFWSEYYFLNWTLNLHFDDVFKITTTLGKFHFEQIGFLIIFTIVFFASLLKIKKLRFDKKFVLLFVPTFFYLIILLFYVRSPYSQYFLPLVYFGSLFISYMIENIQIKNLKNSLILLAVIWGFGTIITFNKYEIDNYKFDRQIQEIKDKENLPIEERKLLKVQADRNIFFIDHDYYWFSEEAQKTIIKLRK
jgi:hypothetical protein